MEPLRPRFWEKYALQDLNETEWEKLCDGCAKCCLIKLEDDDRGDVYYTRVACELLNLDNCRCSDYSSRHAKVSACVALSTKYREALAWLPDTCAYRLLDEGKPLPLWHPLLSMDPDSVHRSGNSVMGKVFSACHIHPDELEDHIIHWVN